MELVQLIPSGDVYVTNGTYCAGPLHYSDWQTDDALDPAKVENTHWNLDDEWTPQEVRVLHAWT